MVGFWLFSFYFDSSYGTVSLKSERHQQVITLKIPDMLIAACPFALEATQC